MTSYGATKPEEDFAEAVSWYIMGNKLTRPQVERLEQFMRIGGRKIRESPEIDSLLGELRETTEQGVEALVRRAGVDGANKPKLTPKHPDKKGVVVAKEGSKVWPIRFDDQSMGHNYSPEARKVFKARHAKNIAKGKMSAAYWADKVLWAGNGKSAKKPPRGQEYVRGDAD